jgi:ribosomal-protein-alanine N-acetyltransferase
MAIKTRRAIARDIPQLLQIERACFASDRMGVARFRKAFESHFTLVVRERDDQIVAYALWSYSAGYLQRLMSIATVPPERRKGHAHALLKRCIDTARRKHEAIELTSRLSNTGAHALFKAHGFVAEPQPRGNYADGEPALHFKLDP